MEALRPTPRRVPGRHGELLNPDLLILGGGGSKKADKFLGLLHRSCEVLPAEYGNTAGIVGATLHAARS